MEQDLLKQKIEKRILELRQGLQQYIDRDLVIAQFRATIAELESLLIEPPQEPPTQ
jgi:hypothetical protein